MGIFDKLKKKRVVSEILQDSLNEEKEDMIRGVVDLSDTSVKEVMIPRIDVDFIPLDMETEALLKRVAESGHSRFPVYAESIDNVVGILYVKDLINSFAKNEPIDLEKMIWKKLSESRFLYPNPSASTVFYGNLSAAMYILQSQSTSTAVFRASSVWKTLSKRLSVIFRMNSITKGKISLPSETGCGFAMRVSIWMI